MTRAFRLLDVAPVLRLQKQGHTLDLEDSLVHPLSPLASALLTGLVPTAAGTSTYILDSSDENGHSEGLIQTRSRLGRPEQDIIFLAPSLEYGNGSHAAWQRLLTHVTVKAGESGCHRIFARLADDGDELQLFRNVGFSDYAQEDVFCLSAAQFPSAVSDELGLRKQRPADSWSLQRLYAAVTPRAVQIAEGLAQGQWQLNYRLWRVWGRQRGYVWEREGEILGVLHLHSGKKGHWLKMLLHPDMHEQIDQLVLAGLSLVRPGWRGGMKPIYSSLRTYHSELRQAFVDLGFEHLASQSVLVKHTTVRAKDYLSRLVASLDPAVEAKAAPSPYLKAKHRTPKKTKENVTVNGNI